MSHLARKQNFPNSKLQVNHKNKIKEKKRKKKKNWEGRGTSSSHHFFKGECCCTLTTPFSSRIQFSRQEFPHKRENSVILTTLSRPKKAHKEILGSISVALSASEDERGLIPETAI